jgi:hypothetical protein
MKSFLCAIVFPSVKGLHNNTENEKRVKSES